MILLRLLCIMAGIMVLIAPSTLFPTGAIAAGLPQALAIYVVLLLASSSFFFIGVAGHLLKKSPKLHRLCLMLLGTPLLAGAVALSLATAPKTLWMSSLLLGFTMFVGLILAYPLLQEPSARRLRAREEARTMRPPVLHHL